MNPRKPTREHAVNAGISLPAPMKRKITLIAKKRKVRLSKLAVEAFQRVIDEDEAEVLAAKLAAKAKVS